MDLTLAVVESTANFNSIPTIPTIVYNVCVFTGCHGEHRGWWKEDIHSWTGEEEKTDVQ